MNHVKLFVHPSSAAKLANLRRTDQEEYYQLLTYTDDVDLKRKLEAWEQVYDLNRPHGVFEGKTPYEVLRSLID